MPWTLEHIERLKSAGKIRDYRIIAPNKTHPEKTKGKKKGEKKDKLPKPMPAGLLFIVNTLLTEKVPFVREHLFAKPRQFCFDVAIYEKKIAIEYEGMRYDIQGGHQSPKGFTSNIEKYKLARSMGWEVWQYTHLNYKDFTKDLEKIVK